MVVGLVALSMITGLGGAVTSLFLGYSVLAALGFYVLAANVTVFAVIGLQVVRYAMAGGFATAAVPLRQ